MANALGLYSYDLLQAPRQVIGLVPKDWLSKPPEPMIDWEKVAGSYAAALAEANSKVAELERACDVYRGIVADFEAKSAPPAPPSRGQQIAAALRFDPLPGSYAR